MARRKRFGKGPPLGKFVALQEIIIQSEAYKALNCYGKAALVQFMRRFKGHENNNNGDIPMSERELAAELRINKRTAAKAIKDLQEKGFIRLKTKGAFSRKDKTASTWTLTMFGTPADSMPANDYRNWRPPENLEHGRMRCTHTGAEHAPVKSASGARRAPNGGMTRA